MTIQVDFEHRTIRLNGQWVRPSPTHFEIIHYLAQRPGAIRSRDDIATWIKLSEESSDRAVDSHIKRIRKNHPTLPIRSYYGVGYFWDDGVPTA